MPNQTKTEKEMLRELEKLVKQVIRKSLKDNTLDYTVQFTVSNLEPEKVKYAAQISSPARGVQPIIFIFDKFEDLVASLKEAATSIDKKEVEKAFHQSRINTFEQKIMSHKERLVQLENGVDEEDPDADIEIPMEEV